MHPHWSSILIKAFIGVYLLLDEIFDGLDPVVRKLVKKIIIDNVSANDMTVVVASHNLRELEELCDRICLMHKGKLLLEREIDEIKLGLRKVQVAFTEVPDNSFFNEINVINTWRNGNIFNLTIKGTEEEFMPKLQELNPIYISAVPMTLEEIFICEMGATHIGDIKEICDIVEPKIGIITAIGPQHLESFKSVDNIIKTKFELMDSVTKNNGITFLNYNNEYLAKQDLNKNILTYGVDNENLDYNSFNLTSSSRGLSFTLSSNKSKEKLEFKTKLIGKHKMPSKLSPNKTIEGCVGGVAGAALIGLIFALVFFKHGQIIWQLPIIGAVSAVISQIGDLTASAIKRNHNIKDYGNLIPGHGGILDRFDSVIFTAPIVFYLIKYMLP